MRSAGFPPLLAHRFPAGIVKVDAEHGTPLRDDNGLCIACARGEVGEAIGRIGTADEGGGRFEGYTDSGETEKKILRDVFAKGDAWFRTGDLMRLDEQGFFHFVDRVGDTFRWKGENVATSEVNDAVRECDGVLDATTYGVEVIRHRWPGRNGGDRRRRGLRFQGVCRLISRAGCRLTRIRFSCVSAPRSIRPRPSSRRNMH